MIEMACGRHRSHKINRNKFGFSFLHRLIQMPNERKRKNKCFTFLVHSCVLGNFLICLLNWFGTIKM